MPGAPRDPGVKPRSFDYVAARDLDHALDVLAQGGADAKILAGGQSLMPMMNFRLVNPAVLLDINRIAGLDRISADADGLTFGPLVRHRMTATDRLVAAEFPVLAQAMTHVAHHTIRNRGTFVGSLCHADPAAEMPMLALLLDAEIAIASVRGTRHVAARDFFVGPLFTALEQDEMVTGVRLPRLAPGTGWGFEEFARRPGDFALAAVAVTMSRQGDRAKDVRIAMMGVADTPVRLPAAESVLASDGFAHLDACIDAVRGALEPNTDLHASRDYRRHLAGVLAGRAVAAAWHRAGGLGHD
jgi:CO/xanthine dehydrogenase FAD-binding subunit